MSSIPFEPQNAPRKPRGRSGPRVLATLAALVIIFLFGVKPYAEFLWFRDDAGYPRMFLLGYETGATLTLLAFVVTWPILYFVLKRAVQYRLVFDETPNQAQQALATILSFVEKRGQAIAWFGAPIMALLFASGFGQNWSNWLLFLHGESFGQKDPVFGLDYGFFVFKLPFLDALCGYALQIAFVSTLLVGGVQVLLLSVQTLVRAAGGKSPRGALMTGLAILALLLGVSAFLSAFEIELGQGSQFVGPGYSGVLRLQMVRIFALILVALAVWIFVEGRTGKGYRSLLLGGGAALAYWLFFIGLVPTVVEGLYVGPNKLSVEAPYAKRAIEATRFGFGLDAIEPRPVAVHDSPSSDEVAAAKGTFDNMRLWDPTVFRDVSEGTQGFKPYYLFNDVDIDRYNLDGHERMVMLSVRDLRLQGLDPAARSNWVVTKLNYTHGFGMVVAPVNEATPQGQPNYIVRDLPPVTGGIDLKEPRIYFSHNEAAGDFAVVSTKVDEFDYPGETDQTSTTHRWQGNRGISLGSFGNRLLFSLALGDFNILIAPNISGESRLLQHRNIVERAQLLYPFLSFDQDPYAAVVNGRVIWILDGYTSTDRIPYGAQVDFGSGRASYVRNSVKVTVDAYTGLMMAYEMQSDPILRTYEKIYPHLIHARSEVPDELAAHFRYPEDLFEAQTRVLTTYHVPDGATFLKNSDAWAIANERGLSGDLTPIKPYFVQMRLPDENREEFLLMRPFSPSGKDNMAGWIAAHCDGDQYGKLTLYQFNSGAQILGPAQMESLFVQDQTIAELNRQLNNDQSKIVVGNMLVIPVGSSMVYAESLFLQSRTSGTQAIPELKKVILATKSKIVVADTLVEAYDKLFGGPPPEAPAPSKPNPSGATVPAQTQAAAPRKSQKAEATLRQAQDLLDKADAALKSGDLAKYGELQKKLKALIAKALQE